jgi:MazG family protein
MDDTAGRRFDRLVDIMRTLRGPDGCPWDREQTLASLRPFVLEETYELLDALDRGDLDALREELGDFLFEAVFLARIAEEDGRFSIGDAIDAIADKLIRRHPHVFTADGRPLADARETLSSAAVIEKWEDLKAKERQTAGAREKTILSGVPRTLPALLRAYELGARAAAVGFDWVKSEDVLAKIEEELVELKEVVQRSASDRARAEEEMGDLLFTLVNLSRKLGIEPEAALRVANEKFQRRFEGMERGVASEGLSLRGLTLEEMESRWRAQKDLEGEEGLEARSRSPRGGREGKKDTKDTTAS